MVSDEKKTNVLIVEDDILIATDLEARLSFNGYTVCGKVDSAEQALSLIEKKPPDLIMMDIMLNGEIKGLEAAEIIRDRWGIPLVFLAGHADGERLERARHTDPFGYIVKPFQDKDLKITLEMALYAAKVDTRRRLMEARLAEQLSILNGIMESTSTPIFSLDREYRYTSFNQAHVSVMKKLYGADIQMGRNILEYHTVECEREQAQKIFERTLKGESGIESSYWDEELGTRRYFQIIHNPIRNASGGIIGLSAFRIDITDRTLAEEKLRRTEGLLNATQRLSKVGGWEWNAKGGKVFWSDEVYRLHDIEPGEFETDSVDLIATSLSCYRPEDRTVLMDAFQKCTRDGTPYDFELPFTTPKRKGWIRTTAEPVFEKGAVQRVIGNLMDITDWKLTEEALRENEEFIRAIMDNLPIGVAVNSVDPDVKFSFINENFLKFYRTSKEKLIDSDTFWEAVYQDPEFRNKMKKTVLEDCASGDPARMIWEDVPIQRKGEETTFITAMNIPVPGKQLMISTVWDVTIRKRVEKEKKKLESQLRQAQKMEAIGTLAGGISHDFNNLLQAINGHTQILLLDKRVDSPDYTSLEAIQTAGNRAADLVRQLLLFSRKAEAERIPVDLNYVVEQAARLLERIIPKMIDIEFHLGSRLSPINADPVQMEQILLNLGKNATDAMPDGGKLLIETQNIVLDANYAQTHLEAEQGSHICLCVSDTGLGMPPETMEHIFEPFFTTKETGKGTGLGLASVYGIVKSHGGHITCYSEIGKGTVFSIYFPAIDRIGPLPVMENQEESIRGGQENILLVDDEESIRDFASRVLEKYGYTVYNASSGEEALEIFSTSHNIDLVLLDIGMPGMGGHKCIRELIKINPAIKVIITSGYSIDGQMKKTLEAGAKSFVAKPYQLNNLLKTVRTVLDLKD